MEYNLEDNHNKGGKLITAAGNLGMDLNGYGFLDKNERSQNVYLWLEDYSFGLFIEENSTQVQAYYSDPYDGEDFFKKVTKRTTLDQLESWAEKLYKKSEEKELKQ